MINVLKILSKIKKILIRILEKFGRRYRYVTIFDYALRHPDKAQILYLKQENTIYTEAPNYHPNSIEPYHLPEFRKGIDMFDWLAVINNVRCFPWSDLVITSEGKAIYDIKDYYAISQYGDYKDEIIYKDADTYCKIHWTKCESINEAYLLDGLFSMNWYHFVTQVLPKLKYISFVPENVPILVAPHVKGENNFHQVMDMFLSKYAPNREIIYMQYNRGYMVNKLYVASAQGLLLPNLKHATSDLLPEWCLYKESTISYIRQTLLDKMDTSKAFPEKIYISRKNASVRRRFNEDEIIEFIQREGFTIIAPEEYSVAEQIALFHNAKCIVACSGAAFTNLLYCSKGCKVIILNNYRYSTGLFATLATVVGAEFMSVNGHDTKLPEGEDIHASFTMPPQKLRDAMVLMGMIE